MEITREQFEAYEAVRASGVTNMWNATLVCKLSNLEKKTVFEIMKRYKELEKQYPGVRRED